MLTDFAFYGDLLIAVATACAKWFYGDPTMDHQSINTESFFASMIL